MIESSQPKFWKNKPPVPHPILRYNLRGKRCFGQAYTHHAKYGECIRIHAEVLEQQPEKYIEEVLSHEFAHLATRSWFITGGIKRRIRPHGPEFRWMCTQLGLPDHAATASIRSGFITPKSARKTKKYEYRCACQTHWLGSIRHQRSQQNRGLLGVFARYHCLRCKTGLTYTGNSAVI